MKKNVVGVIMLMVFTFGLIPGDYWKLLHHHKHYKVELSSQLTLSTKHKTCVSEQHLYDYTGSPEYIIETQWSSFQKVTLLNERHLPHPSFLNLNLRAPPAC